MNVPEVVKIASRMNALIAQDGPASQSHHETPKKPWPTSIRGPLWIPNAPSAACSTPAGALNQFGPWMPTQPSSLLMAPLVLNRKSQSTVIATELVTDGK